MQLINLEKYLDSPTTSCDSTSNVHDCYILLPTKIHQYFESFPSGEIILIDVVTQKEYRCTLTKGREYRINQFRQYINDKNITMGDKITLSIVRNNDSNLGFYIDVEYTNFFVQSDYSSNLYKGYVTDSFKKLFETSSNIKINLDDETDLMIEKTDDDYIISSIGFKKFILCKNDRVFSILELSSPKVLDVEPMIVSDNSGEYNAKDIKELFTDYINNERDIKTKRITTRINYLDEKLPNKLDEENPISIFEINDIVRLKEIADTLRSGQENWEWDRSHGSQVLQTLNMYIDFLQSKMQITDENVLTIDNTITQTQDIDIDDVFNTFINKIEFKDDVKVEDYNNIEFIIGQPNTGKSYNFEESQLFNIVDKKHYKYKKIPVSGGIGNEYKGLQNTDLAITYDPIKEEVRFGEFLQVIMSAIVNPKVPHVVFLDDFHNQDISSLLSEYTPLFKSQQMRDINEVNSDNEVFREEFNSSDEFIKVWNSFIDSHCSNIPQVPLTNRVSGDSLKLVFPSNFYLLGAANFNENTLNIFADWEDRAEVSYKYPIESFQESEFFEDKKEDNFLKCCIKLNENLKNILKDKGIFDYERYCFGLWKVVTSDNELIDEEDRIKTIKFFFGMIKNALKLNNKNSEINNIGWDLMISIKEDKWIKENIPDIANIDEKDLELLHKYNIYEDEI